jgi:hypothetical protein
MRELLLMIFAVMIFVGCSIDSKNKEQSIGKPIVLKNTLNFEGSVIPDMGNSNFNQTYILRNIDCSKNKIPNSIYILDVNDYYHNKKDSNDASLFPFGRNEILMKNDSFCIEKQNGKTLLYIDEPFKRQFSKTEALNAIEILVITINKSKLGEKLEKENQNYKSWN